MNETPALARSPDPTIDTFANVNTNRVVVWERMMAAGTHTVSIINLATAGRARIDLDAVMTN